MALIRCPGCKFDTSDSLAHCPSCGRTIGSSTSVGRQERSPRPAPSLTAPRTVAELLQPLGALAGPLGRLPRPLWAALIIAALFIAPKAFPLVIALAIGWLVWQRAQAVRRTLRGDVLQAFLREIQSAQKSPAEKPLERLRRIERELGIARKA